MFECDIDPGEGQIGVDSDKAEDGELAVGDGEHRLVFVVVFVLFEDAIVVIIIVVDIRLDNKVLLDIEEVQ